MNGIFNFLANRLPLGPLSFQIGPALVGLLAALIPLVIHLSRSRRTKKMRFSTTRFFTDQFLRSYRMSRIREVLLLVCRMALFALLGFGLAQPLLSAPALGALRPGDSASVVLAGRRADGPLALFDRPTARLDDVTHALDGARPSGLSADLTEAIPAAEAQARAATADAKEVYVFSDLQETSWPARQLEPDPGAPGLVVVQVRPKKPVTNVGVTAVQFGSGRPMAGAPFTLRPVVTVAGEGREPPEVKLFVEQKKEGEKGEGKTERDRQKEVGRQKVEMLAGGRWAAPWFHYTFPAGGWYSGRVEVEDAAYPPDNARYFAVEVPASVKILAVDGGPSAVEREDALFFLLRALTAAPEGQKSPIEVEIVTADALPGKNLSPYPLVLLADVGRFSPEAVTKLEDYVAGGGSAFFFLGGRVEAESYNKGFIDPGRRDGGLLPGRLVRVQGVAAPGKDTPDAAFVGDAVFDHPGLAPFRDPGFGSLVGPSITFKALWETEAPPEAVLMKASTGAPLLCEKTVGKGRVLVFTSSPDRSWTNFPIRPSYLPWVHQLVAYLTQGPLGRDAFHLTGDVVELTAEGGEPPGPLLVEKPDGRTAASRWNDRARAMEFAETEQPGVYVVKTADGKEVGKFAVNTENYESKLVYLDDLLADRPGDGDRRSKVEAGLRESRLANRPLAAFVADPADAAHAGGLGDPNVWVWVLLGVLVVAVAEPTLANRISALLYSRSRPAPDQSPIGRVLPTAAEAIPTQEVSAR